MKEQVFFIDTNAFLRLFLGDVAIQHKKVQEVFVKGARGEKRLFTSTLVLFEVFWVAKSVYKKNEKEAANLLREILKADFVFFENRRLFLKALDLFEKEPVELEDCYNIVYALEKHPEAEFFSFDKKALKIFKRQATKS